MIMLMPLIIRKDKNPPRDNHHEGKLYVIRYSVKKAKSTKNHRKANAVLKGGDDTKVRMGGW